MNIQDNGQRNRIEIPTDTAGTLRVVINGNDNLIRVGAGCRFPGALLDIRGNGCVIDIGERCALVGNFVLRAPDTHLLIGSDTSTMGAKISLHEAGTVRIGRDCMFAGDVRMDTSDMHSILDLASGDRLNPAADVEIGDHVWLGYGVYVMKGVRIGAGSVVGAHGLVTRDLPANVLAVGSPAKVIREGVAWDRRRLPMKNRLSPDGKLL